MITMKTRKIKGLLRLAALHQLLSINYHVATSKKCFKDMQKLKAKNRCQGRLHSIKFLLSLISTIYRVKLSI